MYELSFIDFYKKIKSIPVRKLNNPSFNVTNPTYNT